MNTHEEIPWTKIEDGLFRVEEGTFEGAQYSYELGTCWVTWRGKTMDLGRWGSIQTAGDRLRQRLEEEAA